MCKNLKPRLESPLLPTGGASEAKGVAWLQGPVAIEGFFGV